MSEYFQFRAPIFIDGAESVNDIAETQAQLIALEVTDDEKLTVGTIHKISKIKQAS